MNKELPIIGLEAILKVDPTFQSIVASNSLKRLIEKIEKDNKDVESLDAAIKLLGETKIVLPAFSGEKRKGLAKNFQKGKDKAEGKK
eukprot:UN15443